MSFVWTGLTCRFRSPRTSRRRPRPAENLREAGQSGILLRSFCREAGSPLQPSIRNLAWSHRGRNVLWGKEKVAHTRGWGELGTMLNRLHN